MTFDIKATVAAAVAYAPNQTEAVTGGGGDYVPPAEGTAQARFVGYIETGIHEEPSYTAGVAPKKRPQIELVFELHGPKWPMVGPEGKQSPQRIVIKEAYSLNDKAHFFKLFGRMNYLGTATHMAQLLGEAFLIDITHSTSGEGDKKRTFANARPKGGDYTVRAPRYQDPISGNTVVVPVPEAVTPLKLFIWDAPKNLKEMWDSLFIDGTYAAKKNADGTEVPGASKNVIQNKIKAALNFPGSALEALLLTGNAKPMDLGDVTPPPVATAAAADPLAAV